MTHRGKVLWIEGLAGVGAGLRHDIMSGGFEMEVASSVADALRRLRQEPSDVVLTSPSSTVAEDVAVVRRARQLRPGMKMIVLAPEATSEDVVAILRAHAFACFREPFDSAEIISMIHRALAEDDWRDGISVHSANPDWVTLRVASRRLTAERMVAFVDVLVPELPDGPRNALVIAFREILQNAMEHGAGFDPEKMIEVSAIRTASAHVFHLRDPGEGFSLDDLPHAAVSNPPDQPTAHVEYRDARGMRPGGFGILMTRRLVDEVLYNETGNEVVLIQYRS